MAFLSKPILALCLSLLALVACSERSDDGRNVIGTPIEDQDSPSMQSYEENGSQYFHVFDSASRRINFVDPSSQSLGFTAVLPGGDHTWLASRVDGLAFDLSGSSVGILKEAAGQSQTVMTLGGAVSSYALDIAGGYAAFVDDFFSIGLLQFNADGQVLGQWTGGPIVDGLTSVTAGELLDGGKLALVVNDGSLLIVDVQASIAAKAWVFVKLAAQFERANWVGRVEGTAGRVLVLDSKGLKLVNTDDGSIIQTISYKAGMMPSKKGIDHVIAYDNGTQDVLIYYPDTQNSLKETRVKLAGDRPLMSFLSSSSFVVSSQSNAIIKYRLADGLVSKSLSLRGEARVGLSETNAVASYGSALGFIEILNLDTGERKEFKGFNFSLLQK